jgi:hypothetical protein
MVFIQNLQWHEFYEIVRQSAHLNLYWQSIFYRYYKKYSLTQTSRGRVPRRTFKSSKN